MLGCSCTATLSVGGAFLRRQEVCQEDAAANDALIDESVGLALAARARDRVRACDGIRSDTPLIYKAVPSWFVRVEELVEKLLANNMKSYWSVGFRIAAKPPSELPAI